MVVEGALLATKVRLARTSCSNEISRRRFTRDTENSRRHTEGKSGQTVEGKRAQAYNSGEVKQRDARKFDDEALKVLPVIAASSSAIVRAPSEVARESPPSTLECFRASAERKLELGIGLCAPARL